MSYGGGHRIDVEPMASWLADQSTEFTVEYEEESDSEASAHSSADTEAEEARYDRQAYEEQPSVEERDALTDRLLPILRAAETQVTGARRTTLNANMRFFFRGERVRQPTQHDDDIARAQEALTYAQEALDRSRARAEREAAEVWERHQRAQRGLQHFQQMFADTLSRRQRYEEEPSQTAAASSDRTRDLEMLASQNTDASADLVELAYERNDGDMVNAITDLTNRYNREQLERELAERRRDEAPAEGSIAWHDSVAHSLWQVGEIERRRAEAREYQRLQEERRQGAAARVAAVSAAMESQDVAELGRVLVRSAGEVAAIQYVDRKAVAERAALTKQREDLEEQMERCEITEGQYLERMNALRDRYNGERPRPVPPPPVELPHTEVHIMATNYGPLGLYPHEQRDTQTQIVYARTALSDRSWAHIVHDEPPNNEIPYAD